MPAYNGYPLNENIPEGQKCWADLNYLKPTAHCANYPCDHPATTPIGLCDKHNTEIVAGNQHQEANT